MKIDNLINEVLPDPDDHLRTALHSSGVPQEHLPEAVTRWRRAAAVNVKSVYDQMTKHRNAKVRMSADDGSWEDWLLAEMRHKLLEMAAEGFLPGRHANLVAYGSDKDGWKFNYLQDYRGMLEILHRRGIVFKIPEIVYEADEFSYSHGLDGLEFSHKPETQGSGAPIGAYIRWKDAEGEWNIEHKDAAHFRAVANFAAKGDNHFRKGEFYLEGWRITLVHWLVKWTRTDIQAKPTVQEPARDPGMLEAVKKSDPKLQMEELRRTFTQKESETKALEPVAAKVPEPPAEGKGWFE